MVCRKRRNFTLLLQNGLPFLLQFLLNSYHKEIITSLRSVGLRQPKVDVRSGSQISLILKLPPFGQWVFDNQRSTCEAEVKSRDK